MILVGMILIKIYIFDTDMFQLKCIISTVDGEKYCVRDRKRLNEAADLLAKASDNCKRLVEYVGEKHPENKDVKRLQSNFNPDKIVETLPTSQHTAYSENKGEKIAFCLNREKEENEQLIDENTLTFVAIHELSHVMTESIGHDDAFWSNFKFLLENAKKAGIYHPVDYKASPKRYCGMSITDNPYYDYEGNLELDEEEAD